MGLLRMFIQLFSILMNAYVALIVIGTLFPEGGAFSGGGPRSSS